MYFVSYFYMIRIICIFFLSILLTSCGQNSYNWPYGGTKIQSVKPAVDEAYTYEFSGKKCTTGPQSASTFDKICEFLKDDQLNEGCAPEKREELFINAECPGSFT